MIALGELVEMYVRALCVSKHKDGVHLAVRRRFTTAVGGG